MADEKKNADKSKPPQPQKPLPIPWGKEDDIKKGG